MWSHPEALILGSSLSGAIGSALYGISWRLLYRRRLRKCQGLNRHLMHQRVECYFRWWWLSGLTVGGASGLGSTVGGASGSVAAGGAGAR